MQKSQLTMEYLKIILFLSFVYGGLCEKPTWESNENFLFSLILKCTRTGDLNKCLKLKAVNFLDKVVKMKEPLVITEYLSLAKDPKLSDFNHKGFNKTNFEEKSLKVDDENLDNVIWDKLGTLFTTRTIRLNFPPDMFEGRSKEDKIFKKGHGIFLMMGMMGGMMMKMAMAKVALIAGKALIIGKIALVLSLLIALKKLSSHGGGGGHAEVVYTSAEHGSGRNFRTNSVWEDDGNELAYAAHKPDLI